MFSTKHIKKECTCFHIKDKFNNDKLLHNFENLSLLFLKKNLNPLTYILDNDVYTTMHEASLSNLNKFLCFDMQASLYSTKKSFILPQYENICFLSPSSSYIELQNKNDIAHLNIFFTGIPHNITTTNHIKINNFGIINVNVFFLSQDICTYITLKLCDYDGQSIVNMFTLGSKEKIYINTINELHNSITKVFQLNLLTENTNIESLSEVLILDHSVCEFNSYSFCKKDSKLNLGIQTNSKSSNNMLDKNIVCLSLDNCYINVNPYIDISDKDSIASHSITIGKMHEDINYYMATRALVLNDMLKYMIKNLVTKYTQVNIDEMINDFLI